MHLRLNLDGINEIKAQRPFEVVELSISRKTQDNDSLPCIRLFFATDQKDLENLDYKNSENRTLKCIEFKPKGKFLYRDVRQLVQSIYTYCKVIPEYPKDIETIVDVYCDPVRS